MHFFFEFIHEVTKSIKFLQLMMGVKLSLQILLDNFWPGSKHAKISVFLFSAKAGSQACQIWVGTTPKSDPPNTENRVHMFWVFQYYFL